MQNITIDPIHNGPADSGHGGTSAGRFAAAVNPRAAVVRLHEPVPLATPIEVVGGRNKSVMYARDRAIATVRPLPAPLEVGPFGRLAASEVTRARRRWLDVRDGDHMAPTCFACGHHRDDGLGLRPGPVEDSALFACAWRPGVDGTVPDWLVWAALDCPTGFPALHRVARDEAVVTGQLAVEIRAEIRGDGDYQLLSRRTDGDGRRHDTEAALVDERGHAVAVAQAVWFAVPVALTRPGAPAEGAAA